VDSWRETYWGLVPDEVLDDPGFTAARERFWTAALADPHYALNRIAVAAQGKDLIGVVMSGPPRTRMRHGPSTSTCSTCTPHTTAPAPGPHSSMR
jgi:hypothetical protein